MYVSKKSKTSEFVVDSYETGPVGFILIWVKLNWSCSYDAVLTVYGQGNLPYGQLHFLTQMDLCTPALEFQKIQNSNQIMEQTRDSMHTYLHLQSPSNVSNGPMGTQGAAVMNVLQYIQCWMKNHVEL